ncbi:MAG: methyltransferase domain-containing protein [Methylococcaceae bacterium]
MNNCICGRDKIITIVVPDGVLVDEQGTSQKQALSLAQCESCGLIRQTNPKFKTNKQYADYYGFEYPPNKLDYIKKDYAHDLRVAQMRCDAYSVNQGNLLDIGSGSGAFVDECRTRGVESFGCEVAKYAYAKDDQYIYHNCLENINFPTDHFDTVTCHDVLEHVLEPDKFIIEMFRATKQNGYCIIEIPDFFSPDGKHHWKDVEHLWFFNRKQLFELAKKTGFVIEKVSYPVPGKLVVWLKKPIQTRTTILVPPGLGDSFWSIVKMQSFLQKENISMPDLCIAAGKTGRYNGHVRAVPFLKLFPFVNATGKHIPMRQMEEGRKIWKEAYADKGRTIFHDIYGFDYFISFNGHIRWGIPLEEINPEYKCNWHPPMFTSLEEIKYQSECIKKYGRYMCIYLPPYGHYIHWLKEFNLSQMVQSINKITNEIGITPILVGSQWDADDVKLTRAKTSINGLIDLTGKTTVEQVFGCLKGSQLFLGFPSGLTIMAATLGCKTLIVWNDYFELGIKGNKFYQYCCPPDVLGRNYFTINTKDMTVENTASTAKELISRAV